MTDNSTEVYKNIYGDTLYKIIQDFNVQIMGYIEWQENGNVLDEQDVSSLSYLTSEIKKALRIYIVYNIVTDKVEGIANYFNVSLIKEK